MAQQPEISILYITERILVLTYPSGEDEGAYRSSLRHVSRMLRTKHGPCYKIFNSSQRRRDLAALNPGIVEFGWPENLAPPLERICSICKDIDNWLTADKRHLAVLHENGGACRSAVIVACFMHYQQICANEDLALDRFAMRKFFNEQRVLASQKRYVNYFAGLLASEIRINSNPIFLYQVVVYGIPRSSRLYLKIYEKMAPIYLSSVYKNTAPILTIRLNPPVCLRGDIIFKCCEYGNQLLFRCQFNTCAVDSASASCFSFTSRELDDISYEDAGLDLLFSFNREVPIFGETSSGVAETDAITEEGNGGVDRCHSYENFDILAEDDVTSNNIVETNGHSPHPLVRERELSANDTADSGIHSVADGETEQLETVEVHNQGKRVVIDSAKEISRDIANGAAIEAPSKIERKVFNREPEEVVMSTSLRSGSERERGDARENGAEKVGHDESGHRPPPVTPPSKRTFSPLMRPVSPAVVDDSRIDSDLVPTDRYDPQSRAFSYVPLQSLQEHFKAPRKPPTQLVQKIERTSRSTPSSPPPMGGEFNDDKRDDYSSVIKPKSSSVQGPLSSSDIDQLLDPNFYLNFTDEDAHYQSNKSPHLGLSSYEQSSSVPSSSTYAAGQDDNNDAYQSKGFYTAPASAKKIPPPVMAKPSRRLDPAEESLLRDLEEYEARNSVPPSPKPHQISQMNNTNDRTRISAAADPYEHKLVNGGKMASNAYNYLNKERSSPVLQTPTLSMPPPPPVSQQVLTPSPPRRQHQQEPRWDDVFSDVSFARASPPRQTKTLPQKISHEPTSTVLNRSASPVMMNSVTRSFAESAPPYQRRDDPFSKLHYGLKMDSPPLHASDDKFEHVYTKPLVKKARSIPDDFITAPWLESEPKQIDPWLEYQMEKLRIRREVNDPDVQRRKEQEKLLLEELKHVHDERMVRNNKREADYTVEGFGVRMEELGYGIHTNESGWARPEEEVSRNVRVDQPGYNIRTDEPVYNVRTPEPVYGVRKQEQHYGMKQHEPNYVARPQEQIYGVRAKERDYREDLGYRDRPVEQSFGVRTDEQDYGVRTEERLRSKPTDFIVLKRQIVDNLDDLPNKALITRQWSDSAYYPQSYGYNNDYHSSSVRRTHANSRDQHSPSPPPSGAFIHESQAYKGDAVSPSTWRSPSAPPEGPTDFSRLQDILWDAESSRTTMTPTPSLSKVSSPKSILKKPKSADAQTSTTQFSSVSNQFFNGYRENVDSPSSRVFELEPAQPPSNTFDTQGSASSQSYRPETPSSYRPETPAFPVRRAETPLPYHPLLYSGASEVDSKSPGTRSAAGLLIRSPSPASQYYGHSRRSSLTSLLEPMEIVHQHPVFVKDTSKYWYKPNITRDEAINILKDKPPGTFIIRDSNSFPGAFGLALKVATPPPGVQTKSNDGSELVRHFLIEPTTKGVKLKGCNNEPVFGSLAALVYQHSITPLALPCKLLLPDYDPSVAGEHINTAQALLEQGAACNVTYLFSCDTESLTGPEAVRRAVDQALTLAKQKQLAPVSVHFKVSTQGITITDNTRKVFFRRHYPVNTVTFCGLDPDDRRWSLPAGVNQTARIFGFVGRKIANKTENACHIFAEYEPEQPASAIVNFVTKVMMAPLHAANSSSTLK